LSDWLGKRFLQRHQHSLFHRHHHRRLRVGCPRGINVLNDYYDALNGTDANNTARVFPFTGGGRFIQNGVLTLRETAVSGAALLAVVVLAGLWLMSVSVPSLL